MNNMNKKKKDYKKFQIYKNKNQNYQKKLNMNILYLNLIEKKIY